ncbi:MAG TPA: methyltransferase domain-containing protein [Patescibacteria group bacterium]|nr:methyltransferase domain-containing protein [Patescibacteria group bacterium]
MNRLTGASELLDGPLDDPAALVANLHDLARLNRVSGGIGLSWRGLQALGDPETILDVGTGGADIPIALLARAARDGRRLAVTATDSRPEVLAAAQDARPAIARIAGLTLELADGRSLPYPDRTFDVAHASLVVHHLEPDAAVAFLRELRRVARDGIVVNDLVRGRLAWIGTWLAVHTLATGRYARHDGPLSIRRAYSRTELLGLIDEAGLRPLATIAGFAGHRVAIAAR